MFDFLEDNLLIITPNSYKLEILEYLNDNKLIMNIKFMTKSEFKKSIKFDYSIDAIHFLKTKGMKVENAITFLDNLYYIENKKYHNDKLDDLVNIKNELDDNNLLIYDTLFSKILKRRKVVVYGYGLLNKFDRNLFKDATIIPYNKNNKKYDVYPFVNIKDEVEFVFQKICDLLNDGINIKNIVLMNIDSEYYPYIKMMEKFYGFKVDLNNSDTIIGTIIGKKFLDLIGEGKQVDEIISGLKEYEDSSEYSFIINILNKYSDYNLQDYFEEIKYELSSHKIKKDVLDNVIRVKDVFDYINDNEYVFLMNFNSSSIPKLVMDTDYITDDICSLVNVDTKDDENELMKENTLNYLSSINNIIISYKEKSPFNEYIPSFLLDDMDYEEKVYERSFNYSDLANKSIYSMYLDDLVKYGIKNNKLELLYSTYDENDYGDYDNSFSGVDSKILLGKLDNKLSLSYSSVDNYYKCGFKYYLNNILKVNIFEDNFNTFIGHLFHYVLRKMNEDPEFDFNKEFNNYITGDNLDISEIDSYIKTHEFTDKEIFFIEKLQDDLKYITDVVKDQQNKSGLTKTLNEQNIEVLLNSNPNVKFTGFVDKIMYEEKNNETLVSIIDYKTGKNDEVNIDNIEYGLTMQLPSYLYLASHCNKFKNIKFTGFYLQHILNLDVMKDTKKTIDELKRNSLKLDGFSTSDEKRLSVFDPTYENSEMIKGMITTQNGSFHARSKVISDEEINDLINKTHEKIMEAMNNIIDCKFLVNPKVLKGKNKSCEYCSFKDICYHTEKDLVYLDDSEELEEENM